MAQDFLQLHIADDVAVAVRAAEAGTTFTTLGGQSVAAAEPIEFGHKMSLRPIEAGQPIRKFGQVIGVATQDVPPGGWVHTHNVGMEQLDLEFEVGTDLVDVPTPAEARTFQGYRRPDGRAGTRNYIALVSSVNCSATTSRRIAEHFTPERMADYPNVHGVVALTHKLGCAIAYDGEDHRQLARTLAGFARHPNVAASLVLGLGCETSQPRYITALGSFNGAAQTQPAEDDPLVISIQDEGGVARTIARGIAAVESLLPKVNELVREPIALSELILGMECGGSDAFSGITGNPAVGVAADRLVAHGGTAVLAEVPEIYGGEHLLTRRAVSREVAEALLERIRWWEEYAAKFNATIDNNPSVGNKRGGLTTIYEKSLGAIAKGGQTPLRAVYKYAEPVREKGFVVMDTPGYDPASVTGLVAGGAQLVVFTTGRGSCFGCKPAPTLKVATNTPMFRRMQSDMDFDAGRVLDGVPLETVGEELFEQLIAVASGQTTRSEEQGIGDEEFCPWTPGPVF